MEGENQETSFWEGSVTPYYRGGKMLQRQQHEDTDFGFNNGGIRLILLGVKMCQMLFWGHQKPAVLLQRSTAFKNKIHKHKLWCVQVQEQQLC